MRVALLTVAALVAFAANSLLCRWALRDGAIDPAAFTVIRVVAGAAMLAAIVRVRRGGAGGNGSWASAAALLAYAAAFSFAYTVLTAATGALLLFGAVQATMIGAGLARGERLSAAQIAGVALALAGLVWLLLPGLQAPPPAGAALMLAAGIAWGIYTLRGRRGGAPLAVNAGNFVRAAALSLPLLALAWTAPRPQPLGIGLALASGALASGVGYAIWYAALPSLRATTAASVQLAVPVLTAAAGVVLLGEPATLRLAVATIAILGGIAIVIRPRHVAAGAR